MKRYSSEIVTRNMNFTMCTPMGMCMCMCSIVALQKVNRI